MKKSGSRLIYAVFAALVYGLGSAISVGSLLSPAGLYTGGVTGLAQLLSALSGRLLPDGIPIYFLILAINIPLAVFAYFSLGKRFTLLSFLALGMSAMFLQLLPPLNITSDPLLCAVFGGVIGGCGMGLCFRAGLSTGGTDFIIFYIRKRTGKTVGGIGLVLNGIIIAAAGLCFGIELALYSLVAIYAESKTMNSFYAQQHRITVTVITSEGERVTAALRERGIHSFYYLGCARGGYTGTPQTIAVSVVTRYDLLILRGVIREADESAFVYVVPTSEVYGRFASEDKEA